jgi:hypothetical protein
VYHLLIFLSNATYERNILTGYSITHAFIACAFMGFVVIVSRAVLLASPKKTKQ